MLSKIVRKVYGSYIPIINIDGSINNVMYFNQIKQGITNLTQAC